MYPGGDDGITLEAETEVGVGSTVASGSLASANRCICRTASMRRSSSASSSGQSRHNSVAATSQSASMRYPLMIAETSNLRDPILAARSEGFCAPRRLQVRRRREYRGRFWLSRMIVARIDSMRNHDRWLVTIASANRPSRYSARPTPISYLPRAT
jgi:hypothetical protein